MTTTVRLQRYLAAAGVAARRKAEDLITAGRVTVNGAVVTTLGSKVDPGSDRVTVDGEAVYPLDHFYVLFNKPKACITAVTDDRGRPTVMDYLKNLPVPVKPVGRLDFYTEGVLLLTNDGELAAKLLAPASHVPKTYHVKVHGQVRIEHIKQLRIGVMLDDGTVTLPAEIEVLPGESKHTWLGITIHEGKHRQIHRMIEALGYFVDKLQRVAFGNLTFHHLRVGDARELVQQELNELRDLVGLDHSAVARGKWKSKRETTDIPRRAHAKARVEAEEAAAAGEHTPTLGAGEDDREEWGWRGGEAMGADEDRGPGRGEARGPGRGEARGPGRGEARGPGRGEARGPGRGEARGPGRGEARGPGRGEARGPGRGEARGPGRGEARGPGRGEARGPGRGEARGPGRGEARGPGRGEARGPGRGESRGPGRGEARGPGRGEGRGPGRGPRDESRGFGARDDARSGSSSAAPKRGGQGRTFGKRVDGGGGGGGGGGGRAFGKRVEGGGSGRTYGKRFEGEGQGGGGGGGRTFGKRVEGGGGGGGGRTFGKRVEGGGGGGGGRTFGKSGEGGGGGGGGRTFGKRGEGGGGGGGGGGYGKRAGSGGGGGGGGQSRTFGKRPEARGGRRDNKRR